MDVDAFVTAHRAEWDRLSTLSRRSRLSGDEADELVDLYQRAATHLSAVRSSAPDPVLVGRLSSLVARARSVVTGTRGLSAREIGLFVTRRFPAAVYRAWRWWVAVGVVFVVVSVALAWWVASHPDVQAAMATPDQVRQLVDRDFAGYYSAHPAAAFAAQVWTNNAWLSALAVASGVGLRLGWTVVAPGDRPRGVAVAQEGRSAMAVAIGLVGVLLVSGLVEAFVTPSSLPTWVRLAIGFAVWGAFIAYVVVLGGRAVRAGETGDASDEDALPYA